MKKHPQRIKYRGAEYVKSALSTQDSLSYHVDQLEKRTLPEFRQAAEAFLEQLSDVGWLEGHEDKVRKTNAEVLEAGRAIHRATALLNDLVSGTKQETQ